jgi:hypothetical protein
MSRISPPSALTPFAPQTVAWFFYDRLGLLIASAPKNGVVMYSAAVCEHHSTLMSALLVDLATSRGCPSLVPTINDLKRYSTALLPTHVHIIILSPATDVVWCHLFFDCCQHYTRQVGRV